MNTASPASSLQNINDTSWKRARNRRGSKSKIKSKSVARSKSKSRSRSKSKSAPELAEKRPKRTTPPRSDEENWFTVRDILDEKLERGRILYLVDWDGTDQDGRPYDPTWEPAANITLPAINAWREKKDLGILEPTQAEPAVQNQKAQIVVAIPNISAVNPSEFCVIALSGSSQASSQSTLPERMRPRGNELVNQRVIPDSQEISATSASEAYNNYHEPTGFFESQFSADTSVPQGPLRNSSRASLSPGIPSHQPDPRFVGVSGYFANPNISTNPGTSTGTHANRSLLQVESTGPFHGPINESSPIFQTQPELDFDIIAATSSVTTSHNTAAHTSSHRQTDGHASQEIESSLWHATDGGSTQSNSQAAQVVQPLSSHPGESASQSQSDFYGFEEDRVISEAVQVERALSAALSQELPSTTEGGSKPNLRCATVDPLSQTPEPISSTDMAGTPVAGTPQSARERLRLVREGHYGKSPVAALSPAPVENPPNVTRTSTPQVENNMTDTEKSPIEDVLAPLISPLLPLPSETIHTHTVTSLEPLQFERGHGILQDAMSTDHLSLDSYSALPIEQPATLDPSALTLSIENDLEGSPSVATDDGLTSGHPPASTNSGEDDFREDYPRSLLPHVPTGPCEYLVTLPFQASSRPQYNNIIRENEALITEYNASFRVSPFETPRKHVVEKLDTMFSRLFDICDFPPFLDSLDSMSPGQITKHVIGTNAKFSFVAELLDSLEALNSDKKILILARPGKLIDLLGHVIQSRCCRFIRSGQQIVTPIQAKHPLTVVLCSTADGKVLSPDIFDVVIAFDHTFRSELVPSTDQSIPPIILALVTIASIQHLNMLITALSQPLERKHVLMMTLVKAMQYIEEPDVSESLFSIADKFARRIQMPEDEDDEFYWEPQSVPSEVFDDLCASFSQIDATQLSSRGLSINQHPSNRKRSHVDDDNEEGLVKKPRMTQPEVVTSSRHINEAVGSLFGDNIAPGPEPGTAVVSIDVLQAVSAKLAELESKLRESRVRESEFRALSDRAQKEVDSYVSSINNIQAKYMDALKERGIFEANCRTAQECSSAVSDSLDSSRAEVTTLKAKRTELEKKLAEANNALLHSSNPEIVKMAGLEKDLAAAKAEIQDLNKSFILMRSDVANNKNQYDQATQRATKASAENRAYAKQIEELKRKADENVVEVNKIQKNNEVRILTQQLTEQKNLVQEHATELKRIREELKTWKNSGRRETRQSSVPRSPRLSSLAGGGGLMSPRNGTARGPSAMGGPSSSRGSSPQPPPPVASDAGNAVQNAALFGQGPGASRFAYLRD